MFRVILKSVACVAAFSCFSFPVNAVEVYLFKGAGDFSFVSENMHFSRGLNEISETLNKEGIHSEVRRFGAVDQAISVIRKRKPKSIALVGHSMGALASMSLARTLKGEGIEIVYMALLDIPGPVGVAGDNVNWVENYYTINPVYGKLTNVESHKNAKNIHVSGYVHNRLDDAPKVQKGVLAAIRKIHADEQEVVEPQQPEVLHVNAEPKIQSFVDPQVTASVQSSPAAVLPDERPLQPLAVGDPYKLPSVRSDTAETDGNTTTKHKPVEPKLDPVTTASTSKPDLFQRGKNMLRRTSGILRSNGSQKGRFSRSHQSRR